MNCIVIDDEPLARMAIADLMSTRGELKLVAEFGDADRAATWLEDNEADLIFLDIEMPGVNGLSFAHRFSDRAMIVFTTAYAQYGAESYDVQAIDYLLKPISTDQFNRAIDRAMSKLQEQESLSLNRMDSTDNILTVKSDRRYVRVPYEEIIYVEGLKDYSIIYTACEKIVTHLNLKAIESTLRDARFMRISKSYIVNRQQISSFSKTDISLGAITLPIGSSYREAILTKLLRNAN